MIVVCLTLQLNQAVTCADELRADGQEMIDSELFDPGEETRFIGRLFSLNKSYPLMMMRQNG